MIFSKEAYWENELSNYIRQFRPRIAFTYQNKKELAWAIEVLKLRLDIETIDDFMDKCSDSGRITLAEIKDPYDALRMPTMSCFELFQVINMEF